MMKFLSISVRVLLIAFLIVHVYVLSLRVLPSAGSLLMVQRTLQGQDVKRDWKPIHKVSPHLIRAVIAAEDAQFCSHEGIDVSAIEKALEERDRGRGLRGASTITQQTAKNAFLWNGGGFARKGAEAWFATLIDFSWGKRRVMEEYLNLAEWGDGLFGAEAASFARFGKSSRDLTEREAALLAAVLPSPNKWRLDPPGPYVRERAGTLQARMRVVEREGLADCVLGE